MVHREAERVEQIIHAALRQTGRRGLFLSGWSKIKDTSAGDMFSIEAVSHDWLLPRCEMVIHHGGARTTAAGLRAGIPNLVVPFTGDQPFWGRGVHAIGAGPRPILVKHLSVENLTRAITEGEVNAIRERAQILGRAIRNEAGVDAAVKLIERYSDDFHRSHLL